MTQLASEIRQRVNSFGATFEARRKLRMSIKDERPGDIDTDPLEKGVQDMYAYLKDEAK